MIGVYDSGFGGLGVLRYLRRALPHHDFVYLGDSGRAPYGGRDAHTILDFAEQAVQRLFEEGCDVIVVACNTVSCVALRHLQQRFCGAEGTRRILGVTIPGAEIAASRTRGEIGIIATSRTVASGTYITEIGKLGPHRVRQRAAPLLVGIVEEGWEDSPIAHLAVKRYLADLPGIDTLLLGCTHYPLLQSVFEAVAPPGLQVIDPAPYLAERLVWWLARHPRFDSGPSEGALHVLCTGDPDRFSKLGERFLGEPLPRVAHVTEVDGRLAHRDPSDAPRGQVVRPYRR